MVGNTNLWLDPGPTWWVYNSLYCASASGETFLPYYTGLAIDGIVVQKSMDRFSTAVLVMSLLAIGR